MSDAGKKKDVCARICQDVALSELGAPPLAPPLLFLLLSSSQPSYLNRTEELRDDVERVDSGMNAARKQHP